MHSSKKIKICKIESKAFAKYCIAKGADYLGVHVIDFELDEQRAQLCQYITDRKGKVVLLTKERNIERLVELVTFYKPWALQLHYPIDNEEVVAISEKVAISVIPVITDDTEPQVASKLIDSSEFVIYDTSYRGGTGSVHTRRHLASLSGKQHEKVLLAGGVTPAIATNLMDTALCGFDVQGYCRENGRHHYGKTKQLLDTVKGHEKRQLSVSLTDVMDVKTIPKYEDALSLEYQIDYSEGNLYDHFKVDNSKMLKLATELDAPITLHIFESSIEAFQVVIDRFMSTASNNIVRINIQYSEGLDINAINFYDAICCASLYYKDIPAYTSQFPDLHNRISLILPSEIDRKVDTLHEYVKEIEEFSLKEVWFDRKVDLDTVKLVLSVDPGANFIAGEYILENWRHGAVLVEELSRA